MPCLCAAFNPIIYNCCTSLCRLQDALLIGPFDVRMSEHWVRLVIIQGVTGLEIQNTRRMGKKARIPNFALFHMVYHRTFNNSDFRCGVKLTPHLVKSYLRLSTPAARRGSIVKCRIT
jgi:hypothetical protein